MLRNLALAVLLLASPAVFAASADLVVTIDAPPAATASSQVRWSATVRNDGPDAADAVTLSGWAPNLPFDYERACKADGFAERLQPGQSLSITCEHPLPAFPNAIELVAHAKAQTADPNLENNTSRTYLGIITTPVMGVQLVSDAVVDPELPFELRVLYGNLSFVEAPDPVITIMLPSGVTYVSGPENCSSEGQRVTCAVATLEPRSGQYGVWKELNLRVRAPRWQPDTQLLFATDIKGPIPAPELPDWFHFGHHEHKVAVYRALDVTTTADSGTGSLREAIETANAVCTHSDSLCRITFRIPLEEGARWATIRPLTPLPVVTAPNGVSIHGATQTRWFGDTNPDGPEIELSGSEVSEGSGLVLATNCGAEVAQMTINGFPNNGLVIQRERRCGDEIHGYRMRYGAIDNYLGTDATGTRAVPNLRGLVMQNAENLWPRTEVTRNVISGNTRTGIFLAAAPQSRIVRNLIGVTARGDAPLGNGGSGIFVARESGTSDVIDNVLAFNHEFGVSIAAGTQLVQVRGNSIHANGLLGIDYGLDANPQTTASALPEITSARYDAATNTTLVEVTVPAFPSASGMFVSVYANDAADPSGYGEGQYFLGTVYPAGGSSGTRQERHTRFTANGDLRGKWVAATLTVTNYIGWLRSDPRKPVATGDEQGYLTTTSEFSRTVEVQ